MTKNIAQKRIIVGISGASGVVYGIRILELLREGGYEAHVIISQAAELTVKLETPYQRAEIHGLASQVHANKNIAAPLASGSFAVRGMVIAPCSIKTMSEIATGVTPVLLSRAADVCLKERRRLVLMVRETPLHLGHLRSMTAITEMGGIIMPPVPAFYAAPHNLADIVEHSCRRALGLLGLEEYLTNEWNGDKSKDIASV
ncbi:MAG: UbiX family flavin prenyltransferase [Candidatus Symbiobacter sp.]|nr:UbiX family flavin prenyltransferase [Candidatus Symbiobacter sp.]